MVAHNGTASPDTSDKGTCEAGARGAGGAHCPAGTGRGPGGAVLANCERIVIIGGEFCTLSETDTYLIDKFTFKYCIFIYLSVCISHKQL